MHVTNRLTAKAVAALGPGRYADGGGLYLLVRGSGIRSWVFRYMLAGISHDLGLGPAGSRAGAVTLAEARKKAGELRIQLKDGTDPAAVRQAERQAKRMASPQTAAKTFLEVAKLFIQAHQATWKNAKHAYQWTATLETYVYAHFGDVPVADIVTGHVMAALQPIWSSKPETATRVRGRIESVLDYATTLEWRTGPNPARWKGNLATTLPARSTVAAIEHHAALPWPKIGGFMAELREREGAAALALEFTILTAARTGESLGATWNEIDLETRVWTIPAARMKAKREHRVPLTDAAMTILAKAAGMATVNDGFVFPGSKLGAGLSNMALTMLMRRMSLGELTVHGFRSTFRDWASEATSFDHSTAEAALAHTLRDKVEAAYRRGDQLDKRRRLMEAWADYCAAPINADDNVVSIRA